jgi:hypothetical protein
MARAELAEKRADADLLGEMIQVFAQRGAIDVAT